MIMMNKLKPYSLYIYFGIIIGLVILFRELGYVEIAVFFSFISIGFAILIIADTHYNKKGKIK